MDANRARYGTGDSRGIEGQYIRLRYSTQFTAGGRAHTIEMEVPVPVGASAELREQLIREAEANMEQLYRRVEARARGQRPPEAALRPVTQQPAQAGALPPQQSQPAHSSQPARSATPDARAQSPQSALAPATASAGEGPLPISLTDRRAGASQGAPVGAVGSAGAAQQPPTRTGLSSELPVVAGLASMGSGPMKLSEFIQIIRENWGLAPKEAMELLQVKSLNNMNYRDLLRQLEPLVAQASAANQADRPPDALAQPGSARPPMPASSPQSPSAPRREQGASSRPAAPQVNVPSTSASRPPVPTPARPPSAPPGPSGPSSSSKMDGPANIPVYPLREPAPVYKFDEEDEEDDDAVEIGAEEAAEEGSMSEAMARIKIDELRDMRGTVAANHGRLVVLHNLLDSQISDEQFLQLIERLWNAVSDKKLRQDQVEGLISWAKEDYFEDEVRAVLAVLNEQT